MIQSTLAAAAKENMLSIVPNWQLVELSLSMACMMTFVMNYTEAKALLLSKCTWEALCKSFLSIKACKENKEEEYKEMIKEILESTET